VAMMTNLQNEKAEQAETKKPGGSKLGRLSTYPPMSPTPESAHRSSDSDDDNQWPNGSDIEDTSLQETSHPNTIRIPPTRGRKVSLTNSISTMTSEVGLEYGDYLMHVKKAKLKEEEEELELLDDEQAEEPIPEKPKPHKSAPRSKKPKKSGTNTYSTRIRLAEMLGSESRETLT